MSGPLARLPRSLTWLVGAYVVLVAAVGLGLHRPLDRALAARLWQDVPCWGRTLGEQASVLFAAELSLLYALALGALCVWARRPLAGAWIVFLLLAGVGVEIAFKYFFTQPAPSTFFAGLLRASCGPPGPGYPLTIVPTPSSLPSGYSIRAAYFCLLLAALAGARWPTLRWPAGLALGALAVILGASRVTVGWHWPTDVLAGLLLGAAAAALAVAGAGGFAWIAARGTARGASRRRGASGGAGARRGSARGTSARRGVPRGR